MKQYHVTGMSCAACQTRVEKAVSKVPGVTSCAVSLLTNAMGVEGTASPQEIIAAVEAAGYGASEKETKREENHTRRPKPEEDVLQDKATPQLKKRLYSSIALLLILMYFSMGVPMWNWHAPAFLQENYVSMGLLQLLLAGMILVINRKFFTSGFRSLFHLAPNMDTLVALGAAAGFAYSTATLFVMSAAQIDGGVAAASAYRKELYFESAAMILTLITVGKTLEAYSKGRTTDALKSLMKLAPQTANVVRDGIEKTVGIDEVGIGDIFVVRPGENIPVDGIVLEGSSAVNEAALTGESVPVDKEIGSKVSAATMNQSGFLKCEATRVGEDTTLSQIISMVSDAAATKAPVAKVADTISGVFVPIVIGLAILTTAVWLLLGREFGYALARGISVLVVSCPCALGLATPVAIMVGNGMGAKHGILFKTAEALQETGRVQIVALDKTGTITRGKPAVTDVIPAAGVEAARLIEIAASVEKPSEHPLARAVVEYAQEKQIVGHEISEFLALPGNGLEAKYNGKLILGGSLAFIESKLRVTAAVKEMAETVAAQGKTPVLFAEDEELLGLVAIADRIKEDSAAAIAQLKKMGLHVVMLTGDHRKTAEAIGAQAGVDEVIAGVLPDGKERAIRSLQEKGRTAMVGDGINDAPALTRAQVGIAIGAGTDVAMDAADVVLVKSKLSDVAAAIRLSRATYRNIKENLFWALFYNVLLIPLACGVYVHWGFSMNPMWGAAAMSCSSLFVVMNALRLNLFRVHEASHDRRSKNAIRTDPNQETDRNKGGKKMKKTVNIDGMMCEHCEARVKKGLEALSGVASAEVSHKSGTAVLTLSGEVEEAKIRKAIEDDGYQFLSLS